MSNSTIRSVNNGYEFDYAGRIYRVWRDRFGHIVYQNRSTVTLPDGRRVRSSFPRRADKLVRAGSHFCDLLFSCASMIEESDCAGHSN